MSKRRARAEVAQAALGRVKRLGLRNDECWPWPGKTNRDGYGLAWCEGGFALAHRLVYEATKGALRSCALHTCDNPPCCNPIHLFDGTRTENARDRDRKRRQQRGESHYATVYEDVAVAALRECVAEGMPLAQAARELEIPYKYAWKLINQSAREL